MTDYTQLTIQQLHKLNQSAKDEEKAAKAVQTAIKAELIRRTGDNGGFGTRNYDIDDAKVKVSVGKNIKWDQDKLAELWTTIANANDRPDQYMTLEYKVSETAYKAWPDWIKEQFNPARTEKEATVTVEIVG